MFTLSIFLRQADRPTRRPSQARRPLVEGLEGRRYPSGIAGNHIGTAVGAEIVGNHIGRNASLGVDLIHRHPTATFGPEIVGQHIG